MGQGQAADVQLEQPDASSCSPQSYEVLKLCIEHFELRDIARISCSSKALAAACKQVISTGSGLLAQQLLLRAVKATAAAATEARPDIQIPDGCSVTG